MIVIFGGTGTLGNALVKQLYGGTEGIVIISRCELKQKQMSEIYPNIQYIVGDIRDQHWKRMIKLGFGDYVFNLAAMKHVDIAESNVEYCYDVNINGTANTLNWARDHSAKYLFSSTDKAVLPINAYGASKMAAEKLVLSKRGHVFRWGNVLGSRGSVLGYFKKTLLEEKKVYLTHPEMTRFWVLIEDVAKFMIEKAMNDRSGVHIPDMGAALVIDVARCMAELLGIHDFEIVNTEIRPGEKIHECLWSAHDKCLRSDDKSIFYTKAQLKTLIEKALNDC